MRHIPCTGIYLCASKDYWLLDGGIAVINTEILVSEQAAMEVAVVIAGIIPGEVVSPEEQILYVEALRVARQHLPAGGKVRWEENGRLTDAARHVFEQTFRSVQHMLNG
jgi:hypothetical protein